MLTELFIRTAALGKPETILEALKILGIGLVGIFAVIGLLILILKLLTVLFPAKKDSEK